MSLNQNIVRIAIHHSRFTIHVLVAATGLEPVIKAYETFELPLLQTALLRVKKREKRIKRIVTLYSL